MNPLDVARLSPLLYEHIHMLVEYDFTLPDEIARGLLSPLRDPDNLEEFMAQIP